MRWVLTCVMMMLTVRGCQQARPVRRGGGARHRRRAAEDREGQAELRDGDGPRRPAEGDGPWTSTRPSSPEGLKDALVRQQDAADRRRGQGGHRGAADGDGGQAGGASARPSARRTRRRATRSSPRTRRRKASSRSRAACSTRSSRTAPGRSRRCEQTVVCHYRGTLIDGKEFDSSYKRGQPATFPVKGVIKGWTEVLQLMPVGSKWQVFIPSALAYGERGAGADIGPNATLIFEIELVAIK